MQTVRHNDNLIQKFADIGLIQTESGETSYTAPEQFTVSDFSSNQAFTGISVSPSSWAISGLTSPTLEQMQELGGVVGSIRSLHQQLTQPGNSIQSFTGYNIVRA